MLFADPFLLLRFFFLAVLGSWVSRGGFGCAEMFLCTVRGVHEFVRDVEASGIRYIVFEKEIVLG